MTILCNITLQCYIGERAKRSRHYQGCTNSSWCGISVYIYMYGTQLRYDCFWVTLHFEGQFFDDRW